MFRLAIVISILGFACAAPGKSGPDEADCQKALQHEIALRMPSGMPDDLRDRHRSTITSSLGDDYVSRCTERWTGEQLSCITSAETAGSARACQNN